MKVLLTRKQQQQQQQQQGSSIHSSLEEFQISSSPCISSSPTTLDFEQNTNTACIPNNDCTIVVGGKKEDLSFSSSSLSCIVNVDPTSSNQVQYLDLSSNNIYYNKDSSLDEWILDESFVEKTNREEKEDSCISLVPTTINHFQKINKEQQQQREERGGEEEEEEEKKRSISSFKKRQAEDQDDLLLIQETKRIHSSLSSSSLLDNNVPLSKAISNCHTNTSNMVQNDNDWNHDCKDMNTSSSSSPSSILHHQDFGTIANSDLEQHDDKHVNNKNIQDDNNDNPAIETIDQEKNCTNSNKVDSYTFPSTTHQTMDISGFASSSSSSSLLYSIFSPSSIYPSAAQPKHHHHHDCKDLYSMNHDKELEIETITQKRLYNNTNSNNMTRRSRYSLVGNHKINNNNDLVLIHNRGTSSSTTSTSNNNNLQQFLSDLRQRGLDMIVQEGDGNCLFRAISLQVYGDSDQHCEIRKKCIDYMEKEKEHFSQFINDESFDSYICRKRKDGVHGNNLEIQALSELFNRPVEVFVPEYGADKPINIFHTDYKTTDVPIRLSYHDGNHYNAIVDPFVPTAGLGLGLPGLEPGLADRLQLEQAKDESDKLHVKQVAEESYHSELQRAIEESKLSAAGPMIMNSEYDNSNDKLDFYTQQKLLALSSDWEETNSELEQAVIQSSMESFWSVEQNRKQSWNKGRRYNNPGGNKSNNLRTGSPPLHQNDIHDRSRALNQNFVMTGPSTANCLPSTRSHIDLPTPREYSANIDLPSLSSSYASSVPVVSSSVDHEEPRSLYIESAVDYPQTVQELVVNGFELSKVVRAYELIGDNFDDMLGFLLSQS